MPSPSIHGIRSDPQGPHKGVTRGARECTQYPCHIGTFSSTRMLSGAVGRGSDVRAPPTEWLTVIQTPVYGLCNAPGGRWWVLAEVSAIRHTKGPFIIGMGVDLQDDSNHFIPSLFSSPPVLSLPFLLSSHPPFPLSYVLKIYPSTSPLLCIRKHKVRYHLTVIRMTAHGNNSECLGPSA